ncbi:MAG: methyl-accepting chemotaxis protein [Pseudomonadota bacterium]
MSSSSDIAYRKRSRFINLSINTKMQLAMLVKIWLIIFMALLLFAVAFYFYSNQDIGPLFSSAHIKIKNFLEYLFPVVIIGFGISFLVGVVFALFFPHSIAGPLYRIERELAEISQGDLRRRLRLRNHDECKDLVKSINEMSEELSEKVQEISLTLEKVERLLDSPDTEITSEALKKLRACVSDVRHAVKQFEI